MFYVVSIAHSLFFAGNSVDNGGVTYKFTTSCMAASRFATAAGAKAALDGMLYLCPGADPELAKIASVRSVDYTLDVQYVKP